MQSVVRRRTGRRDSGTQPSAPTVDSDSVECVPFRAGMDSTLAAGSVGASAESKGGSPVGRPRSNVGVGLQLTLDTTEYVYPLGHPNGPHPSFGGVTAAILGP